MATYDITTTTPNKIQSGDILNCPFSGAVKSITLPKGQYKLECWGAKSYYSKASYSTTYNYGYGGYASGTVTLNSNTTFYLYVGGTPSTTYTNSYYYGGWNGGGGSAYGSSYNDNAPGAGASDIALVGGDCTLDSYGRYIRTTESYLSRIIVAGGGGGGRSGNAASNGGYGGMPYTSSGVAGSISKAGSTAVGNTASFGYGASSTVTSDDSPGGGGGWYGGGNVSDSYGGGGSSFVWCDATTSYVPSGYSPSASLKMTDVSCIAGGTSMMEPTDASAVGHTGNGYIRITVIEVKGLNGFVKVANNWKAINSVYVKTNNIWKEINSFLIKVNDAWQECGGGGGDSGFSIWSAETTLDTASNSITFENLQGEPIVGYCMALSNLAAGSPYKVVYTSYDGGEELVGSYITNSSSNSITYSNSAFTTSLSNGNLTITCSGAQFAATDYIFVYATGDISQIYTQNVQVASGQTSISFTNLEKEPIVFSCYFKGSFGRSNSYKRAIIVLGESNDNGGYEILGHAMAYSNTVCSSTSWTATYSNGTLTISSNSTTDGGYFHQPGYYELIYS